MDPLENDPDFREFRQQQRRARVAALRRGIALSVLMLFALGVGAVAAYGTAVVLTASKKERLARYEAGAMVVLPRGENIHDTSPSPVLVAVAGLGGAVLVFAGGSVLFGRGSIYARGVANAVDEE